MERRRYIVVVLGHDGGSQSKKDKDSKKEKKNKSSKEYGRR